MERKRILVTAKAYPVESKKYEEVVCTAGITDGGELIRIYPVAFRLLPMERRFKKYQWIEVDVEKRGYLDIRKESHRCNIATLQCLEILDSEKGTWEKRKDAFLRRTKIYTDYEELLEDATPDNPEFISLAVFRPDKIIGVSHSKIPEKKLKERRDKQENRISQLELAFEEEILKSNPIPARIMPYNFYYEFLDEKGRKYRNLIEDWELYSLYWNLMDDGKTEAAAIAGVKKKYFEEFADKDVCFFMGTRHKDHLVLKQKNCFSIISVFYPKKAKVEEKAKKEEQMLLDL